MFVIIVNKFKILIWVYHKTILYAFEKKPEENIKKRTSPPRFEPTTQSRQFLLSQYCTNKQKFVKILA